MDETQTIAHLEKTLDRMLLWISVADSKLRIILPLNLAMLGALTLFAPSPGESWVNSQILLFATSVLLLGGSISVAGLASYPQTGGPEKSLLYFGTVSSQPFADYSLSINSYDQGKYIEDLKNQCHVNANIAQNKYGRIKQSMNLMYSSIIPWLLSLWLFYDK